AKKVVMFIPIINLWMKAMHCIFLDRRNIKKGHAAIEKGITLIRKGYPMLIFPEGTRSRNRGMGCFKKGSIKLALQSEALIVPLSVSGTYKVLEEHNRITPGKLRLVIHPPIDVKNLTEAEKKQLPETLEKIIRSGLPPQPETDENLSTTEEG
ncbi:MAG: lysophospholipid acyltransferase family protein, partial [Spirochaetota bacterium]